MTELKKLARVRLIVEYDVEVPIDWSGDDIEHHRNEISWCKGNGLDELIRLQEKYGCAWEQDATYEFVKML